MFKKSRIKIIALVTAIMIAVILGTLSVIYFTTYAEMNRQNREMLETYAALYAQNGGPNPNRPTAPPDIDGEPPELPLPDEKNHRYEIAVFYSVAFSTQDDRVQRIVHDAVPQMDEEQLEQLARRILNQGKAFGTEGDVVYLVTQGDGYTLVSMMDNTALGESVSVLLWNTAVFGCAAIVLLIGIAVLISGWIIQPLEKAYEKQKQFISDAGHELKTPISTISTNAELLSREVGNNRWLSNIQFENQRMGELVRQLLELTRLEQVSPTFQTVDFSRLVLAGVLPFEAKAFEAGVELSCRIDEDITVTGDAGELSKLISVLLDNAIEHCIAAGTVEVTLKSHREHALLAVSNQGQAIPTDQQEKIFERFYRTDESRTSQRPHYGLGLPIAKAVVLAHGGRIRLQCESGVICFLVTLPLRKK